MSRRRVALLLALLAAALVALLSASLGPGQVDGLVREHNRDNMDRRRRALHATGAYDGPGWVRLDAPRPGEWLDARPEEGQTFEEYVAFDPLVRGPGRDGVVLQPFAPLAPHALRAVELVREHCGLYFAAEARVADPLPIPADALLAARAQYDAEKLVGALAARRPEGALVYAGLCDQDLTAGDLNYVFGLGRFREGLGVYSFARFHHPGVPDALYLSRAIKLLAHEVGHGFGLRHCVYYRCVMNGANSLPELDGAPVEPCALCLRKLQRSLGFDVAARWTGLAAFFERVGLTEDAAWVKARLAELERSGRRVPWAE